MNSNGARIGCVLMILSSAIAYGGTAQWNLNPSSSDWNTAANWTPATVPNGPADAAIFSFSNITALAVSSNTQVSAITFTSGATNAYTIAPGASVNLTISGAGIINDSGTMQDFRTLVTFATKRQILFTGNAAAGTLTRFSNSGATGVDEPSGGTVFYDGSSAAQGLFINEGSSRFLAGGGQTNFYNTSTAAKGAFINNGGAVVGGFGGETLFSDSSSAGDGRFTNNPGTASAPDSFPSSFGGETLFQDTSTAANGLFINNGPTLTNAGNGVTKFAGDSSAGHATFINNGAAAIAGGGLTIPGGATTFSDNASASGALFINNGGLVTGAPGGATAFLGNRGGIIGLTMSTGANGVFINNGALVDGASGGSTGFYRTSTAASATLIAKAGANGGGGGTIFFADQSTPGTARVQVFGNGALDISMHDAPGMALNSIEGDGNVFLGANNLTLGSNNQNTTIAAGIHDGGARPLTGGSLTKTGSGILELTGANTYTGETNVDGGVLKLSGSITSDVLVHRTATLAGSGTTDGTVTARNGSTVHPGGEMPGMLTAHEGYTQQKWGTLLIQIGGENNDAVSLLDVLGTANLDGYLDPVLTNGFVPSIGDSFVFLDYASFNGAFSRIQGQVFDNRTKQWSITYEGNHAVLIVGPNTIPDTGSTLLMLLLSCVAFAFYKRNSRRVARIDAEPIHRSS